MSSAKLSKNDKRTFYYRAAREVKSRKCGAGWCLSFVERHNLTMRMSMRRFTRLTNAFSKKIQNHAAIVAIRAVHYNFARIHKTLRIAPRMAAGLSDHVWSLEEIVMMADSYLPKARKCGPYKKVST
jgi:hypothetical protein